MMAFGLGVLLIMDLGARRNWSYLLFRQEVALNGLPLDENEITNQGLPRIQNLDDKIAATLFKEAGGEPVYTQVDEVKRMYKKLNAEEEKLPNSAQKAVLLAKILRENSLTYVERLKYHQVIAEAKDEDKAKEYTKLRENVDSLFLSAEPREKGKIPASAREISRSEMRQSIAHLLLSLYQAVDGGSDQSMQRLLVVVGPAQAVAALDNAYVIWQRGYEDLHALLIQEEQDFVTDHRDLIFEMKFRAEEIMTLADYSIEYDARITLRIALVAKEKELVDGLKKELASEQEKTGALMTRLRRLNEGLFQVHNRLFGVNEGNLDLAKKIKDIEAKE